MPYQTRFKHLTGVCKQPKSSRYKQLKANKIEKNKQLIYNNITDWYNKDDLLSNNQDNNQEWSQNNQHLYGKGHLQTNSEYEFYNESNEDIETDKCEDDLIETVKTCYTKEELCIALLVLFYSGKLTQSALRLVIKFNKIISDIDLPSSFDACAKVILDNQNTAIDFKKKWLCMKCCVILIGAPSSLRYCPDCNSRLQVNYMLSVKAQLTRIIKHYYDQIMVQKTNNDSLKDITDGDIYNRIRSSKIGNLIKNKEAFTLTINTDGASFCEKSGLSIWPIFLVINELPINLRFCIENVAVAGMSVGDGKSDLKQLFNDLIRELKDLEYGIIVDFGYFKKTIKFFLIAGVYDKPARASVINMIGCNGFFGCIKCLQPGETFFLEKGHMHAFTFQVNCPSGPLRTNECYESNVLEAENTKMIINGIKGVCELSKLEFYEPIRNTNIDTMHSVFLGAVKTLFRFWFHFANSKGSLIGKMGLIDGRLKQIRPPSFIQNAPRSIYTWKNWRAKEFMIFILFYALPVFNKLMDAEYYENLVCLVVPLEHLFSSTISKDQLIGIQNLLVIFVSKLEKLYGKHILNSGVHELLHICSCASDFGPPNITSCYQFEELNRKLLMLVKGKDLVGEEFIKLFTVLQCMNTFSINCNSSPLKQFIIDHLAIRSANRKKISSHVNIRITCKIHDLVDVIISKLVKSSLGLEISTFKSVERIYYRGVLYTTISNKSRFADFYIKVNNKDVYGVIEKIIIFDEMVFVICKKIIYLHCSFYNSKVRSIKSNIFSCFISQSKFVESIESIRKCLYVQLNNQAFFSTLCLSHLFC